MMKMCTEMMGNMDMNSMMQKGMGMAQNCMGMMGGNGGGAPEETAPTETVESETSDTKAPAKAK